MPANYYVFIPYVGSSRNLLKQAKKAVLPIIAFFIFSFPGTDIQIGSDLG
jgi:hypothetical protein